MQNDLQVSQRKGGQQRMKSDEMKKLLDEWSFQQQWHEEVAAVQKDSRNAAKYNGIAKGYRNCIKQLRNVIQLFKEHDNEYS